MKNVELVKHFLKQEDVYEAFQEWLEEHDIEGSEAEFILDSLAD